MLRLQTDPLQDSSIENQHSPVIGTDLSQAMRIFKDLVQITKTPHAFNNVDFKVAKHQISLVLGILSSISEYWANFCEPFLPPFESIPVHEALDYAPDMFRIIFDGICETQDQEGVLAFWELWCSSQYPQSQRSQGALKVSPVKTLHVRLNDVIQVRMPSREPLRLFPRFNVDHSTLRMARKYVFHGIDDHESDQKTP
jgi:hypothetical protein